MVSLCDLLYYMISIVCRIDSSADLSVAWYSHENMFLSRPEYNKIKIYLFGILHGL